MVDDSAPVPSRRQFLGAAGTAVAATTAGCLGSLVGSSSARQIEPEEPPDEREGTPEEFYYFLEENGIDVTELLEEDDELYLTYSSEAETVEGSDEEIMTVYQVYRQALIERGSDIEMLLSEIENPFEEQAHGWGIDTDWIREAGLDDGDDDPDDVDGNETPDDGDEDEDEMDMGEVMVWSNIVNSKVYGEDDEGEQAPDSTMPEDEE